LGWPSGGGGRIMGGGVVKGGHLDPVIEGGRGATAD
jgi:hypothetical protein